MLIKITYDICVLHKFKPKKNTQRVVIITMIWQNLAPS